MNVIAPQRPSNSERDVVEVARSWLEQHGRLVLATVASTWGSAPVPVGGQMVVAPGDRFHGSVSGGCVESDVIADAAAASRSCWSRSSVSATRLLSTASLARGMLASRLPW